MFKSFNYMRPKKTNECKSIGIRKAETRKYQLRNVEFLLGCTSKLKEIIVLGMIAKIHEVYKVVFGLYSLS